MTSPPRSGPTVRSSMTVSGAGKCASAQQCGGSDRILNGKVAGDLARATGDRYLDDRGGQDLAVEDDGEGAPNVLAGDISELARADIVEAEGNDRLVGLLVEGGASVSQALAADRNTVFHRIGDAGFFHIRQDCHTWLWAIARIAVCNHVERHLGGAAEQGPKLAWILQAGELDDDAIRPDALNGRFGNADLVYTPADDFKTSAARHCRAYPSCRLR